VDGRRYARHCGPLFSAAFLARWHFTIPEYLEYRYSVAARTLMALLMMVIYIFVALAAVLYSGALARPVPRKTMTDMTTNRGKVEVCMAALL